MIDRALALPLLSWCLAVPIARCSAPAGWYVNGVHPDGRFELRPVLGAPENDIVDAVRRVVIEDERRIVGRIHCTGGTTPRQDGHSVWCQR